MTRQFSFVIGKGWNGGDGSSFRIIDKTGTGLLNEHPQCRFLIRTSVSEVRI